MKKYFLILLPLLLTGCAYKRTFFSVYMKGLPAKSLEGEIIQTEHVGEEYRFTLKTGQGIFPLVLHQYTAYFKIMRKGDTMKIIYNPEPRQACWIIEYYRNNNLFLKMGIMTPVGTGPLAGWKIFPGPVVEVDLEKSEKVHPGRRWIEVILEGNDQTIITGPGTLQKIHDEKGKRWKFILFAASTSIEPDASGDENFQTHWLCFD